MGIVYPLYVYYNKRLDKGLKLLGTLNLNDLRIFISYYEGMLENVITYD